MRFTTLSILLLGTALAAPIHELEPDKCNKATARDGLAAVHDPFLIHARAFVIPKIVAPRPVVPKPVPRPIALDPVAPGYPVDVLPPRLSSSDGPIPAPIDEPVPVDGPDGQPARPDDVNAPKNDPDTPATCPDAPAVKKPPPRLTGERVCSIKRDGVTKKAVCFSKEEIASHMTVEPDTSLFLLRY
jgi:hypothetical protein